MLNTSGISRAVNLLANDMTVIAVGTGSAPTVNSTQLTSELVRALITTASTDQNTIIKELFLSEAQAVGTLTELGLFCNGATATPSTGFLFASGAANITKTSTQSLTVSFEIELREAT